MPDDKDWNIDKYITKLLPKQNDLSSAFNYEPRRHFEKGAISDELLEECYFYMALVVEDYGVKFLPIFERLHREREKRKSQKEMLEIALSISKTKPKNH